jgi:hypothetical protein
MSDATDVSDDLAEEEGTADGGRPTSFLPSPTFPAAMLAGDGGGTDDDDGNAPAPMLAAPPEEKPAKQGLLIRLGHLFCGRPNGTR